MRDFLEGYRVLLLNSAVANKWAGYVYIPIYNYYCCNLTVRSTRPCLKLTSGHGM